MFASIKYREHGQEYELYSASSPDIAKMREQSELVLPQNLTPEQKALQAMSREVFGTEMQLFDGVPELHGRYDEDTATIYVNRDAETSLNWAFWHEAFHAMKDSEPDLYADLLRYTEQNSLFTSQELTDYRKSINQPNMSDSTAMEEMLADAFADLNTG